MKTAIVIPTLNAVRRGVWKQVLESAAAQKTENCLKIVVDCFSDDDTCAWASSFGWTCWRHKREDFDHGATRNRICRILHKKGIETVVFLSQDTVLKTPYSIQNLLAFLRENNVAGCYGKQEASKKDSFNAWQRQKSYLDVSYIKDRTDFQKEGSSAAFFSNAFSAWQTAAVIQYGGFPRTDFGEDALLAFQVLSQGGKIGYCAEAVAVHDHSDAWRELFLRGLQVGRFHRKHPVFSVFKSGRKQAAAQFSWRIVFPWGVKVLGYLAGRCGL